MINNDSLTRILGFGIIPLIRSNDMHKIAEAAEALVRSRIGVLEISLSVSNGLDIVESLADRFGEKLILGAGTVLDDATARSAISAGARFIVSPCTSPSIIDTCKQSSIAVFPGALTPTEIVVAWKSGADAVKIFPIDSLGGPAYLRALRAPLPHIMLLPCGGVNSSNADEYFNAGAAALLVGTALVDMRLTDNDIAAQIEQKAPLFLSAAADIRATRP